MPLGRFGVKNEYSLGRKELYKHGVDSEDSKVIFDGVAVAGLVGLLRQLGDLSQFAAEIFHGLQEQVVSTASRSRKLVKRIQHIEAILPSLEKAMLSQTSHIHLAYTPGSEWHPRIKAQQNHFVYSDLPHFIMDSYEECREPPRLQLLDRFDTSGRGSCLKRYTDPTFFRRASAGPEAHNRDKARRERKARKKRRSRQRSGQLPNSASNMNNNGREPMSSQTGRGGSSVSHTGSTFDRTSRSDSHISKEGLGFVESLSHPSISIDPDKTKSNEVFCNINNNMAENSKAVTDKDIQGGLLTDSTAPRSSNVTWDEKLEIMEHMGLNYGIEDDVQFGPEKKHDLHEQDLKPVIVKNMNQARDLSEHESSSNSGIDQQSTEATMNVKSKELTGVNDLHDQDMKLVDEVDSLADDLSEVVSGPKLNADAPQVISESFPEVTGFTEGVSVNSPKLIAKGDFVSDPSDNKWSKSDIELTSHNNEAVETIDANHLGENTCGSIAADNFVHDRSNSKVGIGDVQYLQETILDNTKMKSEITSDKCDGRVDNFTEGVNHHEIIDSETDNFVDARTAIDSESESDFETYTRKEVKSTSICKLPEDASTDLMAKQLKLETSQEQPVESASAVSKETQGIEADDIKLELAVRKPVDSSLQAPRDDEIACVNGSVGIPSGLTSSHPRALWTNGTLLGLQPSKPTVFSASSPVNPNPVTGPAVSSGNGHSVDQCSPKVSRPSGTMSSSLKNYDQGSNFGSDDQDFGSLNYRSRDGKSCESKVLASIDLKNAVSEVPNTSGDKSSLLSLLGRNLLEKGSGRSELLASEEKNRSAKHLSADLVSPTKLDGKSKSSVNSPSASPPLEHMKISFRPIDRLENSRLKLKYPEGVDHHEMTVETFPSFQLIPGSTSVHHDMGSDSDDDTFCRSYPCVSDESAGHLSDSDSEQWESGDSSESNEHALCDESRGISYTGSPDLQCLAAQPPPLPPLQWRVSRPVLLGVEDTPERGFDSPSQSFDSHPLEEDSAKSQSTMQETDTTVTQKTEIEVAVPNVDERGDFLHQIRAKSFNLKRTDAAQPFSTPSLPTSNKMTAILQKANAIRQVMGSDGEDDSWSDT